MKSEDLRYPRTKPYIKYCLKLKPPVLAMKRTEKKNIKKKNQGKGQISQGTFDNDRAKILEPR